MDVDESYMRRSKYAGLIILKIIVVILMCAGKLDPATPETIVAIARADAVLRFGLWSLNAHPYIPLPDRLA